MTATVISYPNSHNISTKSVMIYSLIASNNKHFFNLKYD